MKYDAVLIAGPTASGKSQVALQVAENVSGAIINADSMQIYRELEALSARPSPADMARVPHYLYGHVSVRDPYSVGRYQSDAQRALDAVRANGRLPIFVGGTGLYFAALTEGLADIPPVPTKVREAAREKLASIGAQAFHAELASRDSEMAATLRASDRQRVLRAFEVYESTGRSLAFWQAQAGRGVLRDVRLARFIVEVPRAVLRERIEERFAAMLRAGAQREAATLADLDPALPAAKALGVRELNAVAAGTMTQEEATARVVTLTRQYAKRQATWFRHRMTDWTTVAGQSSGKIVTEILSHLA